MKYNTTEINQLLHNRRSIFTKQFTPGMKVDDDIVKQMLENANWAPTHHLTEPWRFKVYTGEGLTKLADLVQWIYKEHTLPENFAQDKHDKLRDPILKSSHVVVVCMKRATTGKIPPLLEEEMAVACAIENMYITATAYGVGGYLSTGGVTNMEAAKISFGLAPEDKIIGFFYIGHYEGAWPESHRKPVEEKIEWHDVEPKKP